MEEKTFTVITYNIDAQSPFSEERLYKFIEQIKEWNPDILTIQEGTKKMYEKLFLTMKNMGYKKIVDESIYKKDISEVIFSKFPILKTEYIRYKKTKQSRNLTLYFMDIRGQNMCICTTQLESGGKRTPFIRQQLSEIEKRISRINEPVILTGDFQLVEYQKDICGPKEMTDVWYEAGLSNEKYTVDSKINLTVKFRDRPDRIFYRSSRNIDGCKLECVKCLLVGIPDTYMDSDKNSNLLASNHFGVYAKFERI